VLRISVLIFSFLLLAAAHIQVLAQQYTLRYDLPPGTYHFKRVETTTALAQSNDGRSTTIDRITTRYYTVTVDASKDGNIHYEVVQDTAIVEDSPGIASSDPTGIAYENILSGKRMRAVISPLGTPVHVEAMDDLNLKALFGPMASESIFLQEAFIFPTLPERTVESGMTWTETQGDTLFPKRQLPGYGNGDGVRLQSMRTAFTVGGMDREGGSACLELKWKSTMLLEDQTIYAKLEDFTETSTTIDGSMCFDVEHGRLLKSTVNTRQESTRALFGEGSSVVPSSTTTEMTFTYIPS
jgi:hypothetical protein